MYDPLERYRSARDDIAELLDALRESVATETDRWHDADDDAQALARTVARLREGRFVLAVVGEFSSGKSFLLNALLEKVEFEERPGGKRIAGLLATDINPSTATITELSYAVDESATAVYASGREERVPLGRLARFVAVGEEGRLHDATDADDAEAPVLVRVAVDSAFLKGGFVVADTPGLASINPAHRRATLSYLPGADAVLYLIDTQQPFTEGDASFLGIVRRYIESVFIVQTKIDLWRMADPSAHGEAWQAAAQRILEQTAKHAPGTPVFPLSAREYAEGLLTHDDALAFDADALEMAAAVLHARHDGVAPGMQHRCGPLERVRVERQRVGGAGRDATRFAGGAAQPRAAGRRDQRCVERSAELAEAALRNQRVVVREQSLGVFARGEGKDGRPRRVLRRLLEDALRGGLPRLTVRGRIRHAPEIDLRLNDEHRLDVTADDPQERGVAFGERLLRVDQVEHRVRPGEIRERRAPVRRIDRREARRVGDDEAALQEGGVDGDAHQHRRFGVVRVGRVVQPSLFAHRDEPGQPAQRHPL